jgi:type II secretory ATPase GspE/PulE/Tfp pilus assembly ATPase PilB-like protein
MTSVDLKKMRIEKEVLEKVPIRVAMHYGIMPIFSNTTSLGICVPVGFDARHKEELRVILGKDLELHFAAKDLILDAIRTHYGVADEIISKLALEEAVFYGDAAQELHGDQDASVSKLVNELILDALSHRATDIHLEPFEDRFSIRYRVDGLLREANISAKVRPLAPSIVSRIKIMASLDIGEKRLPQDGRIKVKTTAGELDLRVSVLPSACGEAVVIRILGSIDLLSLEKLGFSMDSVLIIREALKKPHGIVLLTGPTGSGKTTTLYSILKELNTGDRKIITIEDPVEYRMPGVLQMQVKPQIDFTFAKALRSMLRHDPDILMVGEIRDAETAEIAIRSALTGHLVFSTLHTNDAASSLTRLTEMGIAPYLVASAVELVIAQRLVRTLCTACKRSSADGFEAVGCDECRGSGYHGREAIEETLRVDDEIRALVLSGAPSGVMNDRLRAHGMRFLTDRGLEKVREGLTSAAEIGRVC